MNIGPFVMRSHESAVVVGSDYHQCSSGLPTSRARAATANGKEGYCFLGGPRVYGALSLSNTCKSATPVIHPQLCIFIPPLLIRGGCLLSFFANAFFRRVKALRIHEYELPFRNVPWHEVEIAFLMFLAIFGRKYQNII